MTHIYIFIEKKVILLLIRECLNINNSDYKNVVKLLSFEYFQKLPAVLATRHSVMRLYI